MKDAVLDIAATQSRWRLIGMLGWQDLKHRYRRSLLGPFWLTLSAAVFVATVGLVFGSILPVPMSTYIPYLATGMILWLMISSVLTDSCQSFVGAAAMIKQSDVPLFVYVQRTVWRNLLMFFHNGLIIPVAFLVVGRGVDWIALAAIPGFILIVANLGWVSLVLAILSTRYRDLPQTVASILPVFMFLTPIIWMADLMPHRLGVALIMFNPVYRLILLVREPLLGEIPSVTTYVVCILAAVVGWIFALALFARTRQRIVFWL
jgi:lipopolysaccharide transport system permease protein